MKNSVFYFLSDIINKLSKFLLLPIYIKFLSVDDVANIFIYEAISIMTEPLFSLGLQYALSRYYLEFNSLKESENFTKNIFFLRLILGGFCLLVLCFATFIFRNSISTFSLKYLFITYLSSFLMSMNLLVQHKSIITQTPLKFLSITSINFFTVIILTPLLIFFYRSFEAVIIVNFISSIIVFIYCKKYFIGKEKVYNIFVIQMKLLKDNLYLLRFTLPFVLNTIALLCLAFFDRIILSFFLPKSEVAVYSTGYQFASILPILGVALKNAYTPLFYKNANTFSDSKPILVKIFILGLLFCFVFSAFSYFLSDTLFVYFFGSIYIKSSIIFKHLLIGMTFCFFYILIEPIIIFVNQTHNLSIIVLLATLINIFINFTFVKQYGIRIGAIATNVSYFLIFIGCVTIAFIKYINPNLKKYNE